MTVYDDIEVERVRAHKKHSAKGKSCEQMAYADPYWMPVVGEEISEAADCIEVTGNQMADVHLRMIQEKFQELDALCRSFNDKKYHTPATVAIADPRHFREELIQSAAMICALVDVVDKEHKS